jgi:hypothetical protein
MAYPYAWAVDFDVPLVDLTVVADELFPYVRTFKLSPSSPPINRFPIREMTLDAVERAQGSISHVWSFILPMEALSYILTSKFTVASEPVVTRDMTIYTADHEAAVYSRWNARVIRPMPGQDYRKRNQLALDVAIRMILLEELSEP